MGSEYKNINLDMSKIGWSVVVCLVILSFSKIVYSQNLSYQLVWSDEFDGYNSVDTSKWFHQTQLPIAGSWYNGEIQHYTNRPENSSRVNGILRITAKKETYTDQGVTKDFTSARLNSKYTFKYGRVEYRAKLPSGFGTWPAVWLLGKNIQETGAYWDTKGFGTTPWPACGEIDMLEHWGSNQNFVQSAIHSPSSFGNTINKGGLTVNTVSSEFHTYAMEWTEDYLTFSIDSIDYYTYYPSIKNSETWPFDAEFYLLINFAIQGNISSNFTQASLELDYIRVYQKQLNQSASDTKFDNKVRLFPNPANNVLNIELTHKTDEYISFNIYTIDGRLIKSESIKTNTNIATIKNIDDLEKGVYILSYTLNGILMRSKFYKN